MATLEALLADVLGDEPTDRNIWLATRKGSDGLALATELFARYEVVDPEPIPAKGLSRLRPAFLNDYVDLGDGSDSPYDREFSFVGKSLLYADEVAVVDELERWASSPEAHFDHLRMGAHHCDNATWALRRIAKYAPLERSGLLFYVSPPAYRSDAEISAEVSDEMVDHFSPLIARRKGWVDLDLARECGYFKQELSSWFREFDSTLDYASTWRETVDPYLASWFAGPELLEWFFTADRAPDWIDVEQLRQQQAVTHLLSLPAPAESALLAVTVQDLVRIREGDQFAAWRDNLRRELVSLGSDPTLLAAREFQDRLKSLVDSHSKSIDRSARNIKVTFGEIIQTGIAVAPVAAVTHQEPLGAAAVAAAALVPRLARSIAGWLRGGVGAGTAPRDLVTNPAQAQEAVRLFLTEPPVHPRSQDPPTAWLRDPITGRPVAFDLFGRGL